MTLNEIKTIDDLITYCRIHNEFGIFINPCRKCEIRELCLESSKTDDQMELFLEKIKAKVRKEKLEKLLK